MTATETLFDPGAMHAPAPRPRVRRKRRRGTATTPAFDPLVRENVMQAERELQQTLRLLDKRAKRMSAVTTSDADELREFFQRHPSLRVFPGLTGDDVLARCSTAAGGCHKWLLVSPRRGRNGVPECVAAKVGAESFCAGCLPAKAKKPAGYAVGG